MTWGEGYRYSWIARQAAMAISCRISFGNAALKFPAPCHAFRGEASTHLPVGGFTRRCTLRAIIYYKRIGRTIGRVKPNKRAPFFLCFVLGHGSHPHMAQIAVIKITTKSITAKSQNHCGNCQRFFSFCLSSKAAHNMKKQITIIAVKSDFMFPTPAQP